MTSPHRELPVNLNHGIYIYLHHVFPVSIILSKDYFRPWYYQNFTNIFSIALGEAFDDHIFFDFLPPGYWDAIDQSYMSANFMLEQTNIIDFITKRIDENCYVSLDLDEYYIPFKSAYHKYRYMHPLMIYGYDSSKMEFLCIANGIGSKGKNMNIGVPVLGKYILSYEALKAAYAGMQHVVNSNANFTPTFGEITVLFKLKDISFPEPDSYLSLFDGAHFVEDLRNYVLGKPGYQSPLLFRQKLGTLKNARLTYGIDVLDQLIEYISAPRKRNRDNILYSYICLVSEHKKAIYERLKILLELYDEAGKWSKFLEYKKIANKTEMLKFRCFKYIKQNNQENTMSLINGIKEIKNDELKLLNVILEDVGSLFPK